MSTLDAGRRVGKTRRRREIELTYCVVNTSQRELLLRGLDAIARERAGLAFATEVLVLDNGSRDGSAEAARAHPTVDEVIALDERRGKALNDSELLRRARGRYALLLNEDSELLPGATLALFQALEQHPDAACAGAALRRPDGSSQPSAWRFPTTSTAFVGALFMHRLFTVQSKGEQTREVDWCQSAALLVRRSRRGADRLPRSGLLRLLRRGRLRATAARCQLVQPLRAGGGGDPSRAALDRHRPRAPDRRDVAQPRPVYAQAPLRRRRAHRALADGLDLRPARARRARAPRALTTTLLAPRHRDAAPRPAERACARPPRSTTARRLPEPGVPVEPAFRIVIRFPRRCSLPRPPTQSGTARRYPSASSSTSDATTRSSSCEPETRRSSARASRGVIAGRYGRSVTIAS